MTVQEKAFDAPDGPIRRIGARSVPAPFSPPPENYVMPSTDWIAAEVRGMMGKAPG
jgi:pyruvate/2-oxoglutarate/acetoin dehydrogenase E1 component